MISYRLYWTVSLFQFKSMSTFSSHRPSSQGKKIFEVHHEDCFLSDKLKLQWPNRGTSCNRKEFIENLDDAEELANEFKALSQEKIITKHAGVRLGDPLNNFSGIRIAHILAVRMYLQSYDYDIYS